MESPPKAGSAFEQAIGSPDALASDLAARFWDRLRLFARRRLCEPGEAEDVAQETLQVVLTALRGGKIENLAALPAFLYQTATHLCLHRQRSLGRHTRAIDRFAETQSRSPAADSLEALISDERRGQLRKALERLEDADRELLRMIYSEDLDNAVIAMRLGITPGALRVRRHRAVQRLAALVRSGRNDTRPKGTL
jgi:RNA polymerase sigma-70 factor, ECF subfamily